MRKMTTFFMLLLSLCCFAPTNNYVNIPAGGQINPFKALLRATGIVESSSNNYALNAQEGAYGRLQIRAIRLRDYEIRTGITYQLTDMYDYEKAKEVFMYYASKYSPYEIEEASKAWNGSGPMVENYWNKIQKHL